MPYSAEHKQQSRNKILNSAMQLFTQHGFEKTSIDEIMQHANMTRGAFYAHFSSKSDLYQKAIISGALNSILLNEKPAKFSQPEWVDYLVTSYLSEAHVRRQRSPCPLAFLATDVAVSEPEVRQTYTSIFKKMNKLFSRATANMNDCDEEQMYALLAMMIGAVSISRCIDNRSIRNKLLNGSRRLSLALINGKLKAGELAET